MSNAPVPAASLNPVEPPAKVKKSSSHKTYASPQVMKSTRCTDTPEQPKYVIGVCAMDTKSRSKPMRNILNRLLSTGEFDIIMFGDKVILDEDVTNWPHCDFLISFFSKGFPLEKAIKYTRMRDTTCVNDLPLQQILLDRRFVLSVLDHVGVRTPRRLVRNNGEAPNVDALTFKTLGKKIGLEFTAESFAKNEVIQVTRDTLQLASDPTKVLRKPFVEKPVSGEDHNIHIYYSGGGVRRLFRKVANKSSDFIPDAWEIRKDGSYIYEEFMTVDNAEDVKVYTLGPDFAHAETRKSPVVDGHVLRNAEGKEVRYVTELNAEEAVIAKKVCESFGQFVCGFDLLRTDGKSYVIDVNGWSFVKGNDAYYDKCSSILRNLILSIPRLQKRPRALTPQPTEASWRLKAFISVLRHGDRTVKRKWKAYAKSRPFLDLAKNGEETVYKKRAELDVILNACRVARRDELEEEDAMLDQLLLIVDKKGGLSTTKVQVKPIYSKDFASGSSSTASTPTFFVPISSLSDRRLEKVQIIVKWGGEFTHGGAAQSKDFGENLRKDLEIINKSLLDNVKIYSSSEPRVTNTADVFAKSLLSLTTVPEGMITVSKEMLDDSNAAKERIEAVKCRLQQILTPEGIGNITIPKAITEEGGPEKYVAKVLDILTVARSNLRRNFIVTAPKYEGKWCCDENALLFRERWEKLFKDFLDDNRGFEPAKVSDLYDSLKYDLVHHRAWCEEIFHGEVDGKELLKELFERSKVLFDFIAPQEYGIEKHEKLEIGMLNSHLLLKNLVQDIHHARDTSSPLTRIYFTKESKVICLMNIVLLCGLPTVISDLELDELDYLTQISFELYERNRSGSPDLDREWSLRIGFSPGAHAHANLVDLQMDETHSLSVSPRRWITDHISLDEALVFLAPKPELTLETMSSKSFSTSRDLIESSV